ncbi:hypothetical protein NIES25_36340 [Nostoc linckia NIES-25]|nr:hypothetical protein NIES25_36340 [Nostoc linckia NIES-25]
MEEILNQYCKQDNPGLLLLSMPTGFGKTYNVLNFIYFNYKEFAKQKRKILFITNLKKNLPIDELKKRFIANRNEEDFEKYVLFIDSNFEPVIKNLLNLDQQIPDKFKNKIYLQLKKYIEMLQHEQLPSDFKENIKTDIRKNIEPAFRDIIKKTLSENFKTKKARLSAIKNNQDYQWIGKLYPAVFTDDKTILFLSIDKFVAQNTTLIEPSYYFSERFINKSLIFIDEFDTTKETVLKNIIQSGLRNRVDLIDLFLNIHNHLMQSECPEVLLQESKWRKQQSSAKNWLSLREQIESLREKANYIFKKYQLQHICKSHDNFSTKERNFLFYDYKFHNVLDRNQRVEIIGDINSRTNWINAFNIKDKKTGIDIQELLSTITGYLSYFQTGIKYLANNYRHLKEEDKGGQETFPFKLAIQTVLNNFHLKDVEFLTRKILEDDLPYGLQPYQGTIQNQTFYDRGFRYYDIVDSDEHDTLSKIYMFNFSRTPESFLAGVCSKALVVGISATAGLYTNIGNYDLKYLKSRLGDSFIRIKDDALVKLKNAYNEATQGYNKVSIKTKFIGTDIQKEAIKQLEDLFNDREIAQDLWNTLRHTITNDDEESIEFSFCRYVRALTAWKYFLDNPDCHAFLCLFSKLPKPSDPKFDLHILHKYAGFLLDSHQNTIEDSVADTFFVLSSNNFEVNKEKLLNELKDNKRRFIISAYQTIGVGQNLQFPVPSGLEPIHINSLPKHSNMDINGIYLDNPRNILVNIFGNNINDDEFIKYIFQLEFIRENGDFSLNQFKSKLDEAFHRYIGRYKPRRKAEDFTNPYNTNSYSRYLNKIIIQALGRICRTNMKAPKIHILADASIRKHLIGFSLPEDVIPIREYTALLESAGESTNQSEDLIEAQNCASHKSNQTAVYIRRQLSTPWTKQSVKKWQELREQVLYQPSIVKESECNINWNNIYLHLPKPADSYYFSHENDYDDIEVFFSDDYGKREVKEVSEQTARLKELMKIDGQAINIVDRVNDEDSTNLVITLKEFLLPYITNEKLITVGKRDKESTLNFRIIHDAEFYEKSGQKDEYLPSTDKFQRQHLTIESTKNVSKPIVKTIIKEQLIKRDISSRTLNLFDWAKLQLKGIWTFAAWDEDTDHVIFMEIQSNGNFEFYEIDGQDVLFNWQKFEKYRKFMTEDSSGDKIETLEGLVISDAGDINQIFITDEISIPDLSKIEAILKEVETELPEDKQSGDELANIVEEFLQEVSELDVEKFKSFSSELIKISNQPISKRDFKHLIAQYLGTTKKVGDKNIDVSSTSEAIRFRDYLLDKHEIRLKFPQDNQSKEDLFDASLNIKYFGETEKEAYYLVGDRRDNVQFHFKDACHLRKIVAVNDPNAVNGSKLIFRQLLETMDVDFVRTGQSTVIPFPFKYIREYKKFGDIK